MNNKCKESKTMKTKIEIKDIYGNALFTHEHEGNSAKETVGEAVRQNVQTWVMQTWVMQTCVTRRKVCGGDVR